MLTDKQEAFVQALLMGKSQREAYRAAYNAGKMKENTIDANACRLMADGKVAARYEELRSKVVAVAEKKGVASAVQVLEELSHIAFANGADFAHVTDGGHNVELVDTDTLPEGKRAAIAGIKATQNGIEVKTYDKVRALELLGKHLGMFTDNVNLTGEVGMTEADRALLAKVAARLG